MFKVRCKCVSFLGDDETFPCHFNYKVGDEFYYDGVYFTGRICPGLFTSMMPVIRDTFSFGNNYKNNAFIRYRGPDKRDPNMAKYDGMGYSPLKTPPEVTLEQGLKSIPIFSKTESGKVGHFACGDPRTLAYFECEAVDLSDGDYCQPFYRRAIAILERIEAEDGIKTNEILDRFSTFERDEISPQLTPGLLQVLLNALAEMRYVEIHDGKAYVTGKEPPSRPVIG